MRRTAHTDSGERCRSDGSELSGASTRRAGGRVAADEGTAWWQRADGRPLRLHLGCGKRYIPGFVHVDLGDFRHIDLRNDVRSLPMFADQSVDVIYCSHAFEYFDRQEAAQVLVEWRRVLRPGGILRLAVPDFEALVVIYRRYGRLDQLVGPLYGRWHVETTEGPRLFYHKTVYDFASLRRTLEEGGFANVQRYDWRETIHRDYDDFSQSYIPHMDKEHGFLMSLNVEADRP